MTVRRLKGYTAESGRVFEYYFVGKRPALSSDPHSPATEYVFDVLTAGLPKTAVSVFLTASAQAEWQNQHIRELSEPEQYAAAKMKLFGTLDEWEPPARAAKRVVIEPEELADLLLRAGVD